MSRRQRSCRIALLALLTVISANGCFKTEGDKDPNLVTGPNTYKISSQADFDALKPLVFNGGDQILFERGHSFQGALSLKRSELRPGQVITVADFGPSSAPRPVINDEPTKSPKVNTAL